MKTLAAALVEAQKKMPVVPKTATADTGKFRYSYATLDQLIEKTKPVLVAHGLVISQFPTETMLGHPGLKTVLLHGESGESIEATVPLLLNGHSDMQALGGAITYARRYGWAAVLGIANDEDDDASHVSARPEGRATQASAGSSAGELTADGPGANERASGPSSFQPPELRGESGAMEWRWGFGKNKGLTLAETPLDYLNWFLERGQDDAIKERIREFLNGAGGSGDFEPTQDDLDSIPF